MNRKCNLFLKNFWIKETNFPRTLFFKSEKAETVEKKKNLYGLLFSCLNSISEKKLEFGKNKRDKDIIHKSVILNLISPLKKL